MNNIYNLYILKFTRSTALAVKIGPGEGGTGIGDVTEGRGGGGGGLEGLGGIPAGKVAPGPPMIAGPSEGALDHGVRHPRRHARLPTCSKGRPRLLRARLFPFRCAPASASATGR